MTDLFNYPDAPGFKERDTSMRAAEAIKPKAPMLRAQCLDSLRDRGPATADEVASRLGLSVLSVRPRITELAIKGKIADTGQRHPNASGRAAKVWRAVA